MKRRNKILNILIIILILVVNSTQVYAHRGRTDGSGGHRDKNNVSGLGSYHYHHGMGPHLHPDGVCPYSNNTSSSNSSSLPITPPTPKKSITFTSIPSEMKVGESFPLDWTTSDSFDKYQVEWSTSDRTIASIGSLGLVSAHKKGNVKITGKLGDVVKSFSLVVSEIEIEAIQIPNKPSRLKVGMEHGLIYSISPHNATKKSVTWESTNDDVASISEKGLIRAQSPGNTTIKIIASSGFVEQFDLEIYEIRPTGIYSNHDELVLAVGETVKFDVGVIPDDATYNQIERIVSNEGFFEIKDDEIVALKPGISSIVLKVGDLVKEIPVEIRYIPVERIDIDYETIPFKIGDLINVGSKFTPKIAVYPENATDADIVITANNDKVKVVDNRIEILGKGNIELIVSAGEVEEIIKLNSVDFESVANGSIVAGSVLTIGGVGIITQKRRKRNDINN